MLNVEIREFGPSAIRERLGGAQVRVEIPVALQDVELFCGTGLVISAVRPGAGAALGVLFCEIERSLRDP